MVLIDIEMPSCCVDCPLYDDQWDYPACYATDETRGYNFKYREKRMPGCPLREFNKNGRIVRPKSLGFDTRPKSLIGKKENENIQ